MFKKISTALDRIAFLVVPLVLLVRAVQPVESGVYRAMIERGEWSLNLLYIIIFMKPILVLLGHPIQHKILHFRRHLGMLSFWFALFHTGGIIRLRGWRDIDIYLGRQNFLFWGAVAMIGMLILALTTNYWSIKKMKRCWKRVQYLAYPALFMTMLHEALIPRTIRFEGYEQVWITVGVFGVFIVAKVVEYAVKKKKTPTVWDLYKKNY